MEKRKIWKPRRWKDPQELIDLINGYFDRTPFEEITVTWLCLAIWASKQLLIDYESREWFSEVISEAKMIIENSYELSLRKNWRTWDIFALKNFWWKDKTEVDQNVTGSLSIWDILKDIQAE